MVEFLAFTADEWGQDGVGGDSMGGYGCLGRFVQVVKNAGGSLSGGGGTGTGGGGETINPVIGGNSGKAGGSYSPFFNKQIAPAENPPVPQTRLMGSPDARVAPETQPPVPLAGGMYRNLCVCRAVLLCL